MQTAKQFEIQTIPKERLKVAPFQRPLSDQLVRKLMVSIDTIGFIIPLAVVRLTPDLAQKLQLQPPDQEDEVFLIIDGQHRFHAGVMLGMTEFPCVIVDSSAVNYPQLLNIEKADNIKDKCEKLYKLYKTAVLSFPTAPETALEGSFAGEAHIAPLMFAYKEAGLKSPALLEGTAKKLFPVLLELPLTEAQELRLEQAKKLALLEQAIETAYRQSSLTDWTAKQIILSTALKRCYGEQKGKRTVVSIADNWETALSRLTDYILKTDWSWLKANS